ncbi:SRPBCC family protein [Dermatophilus congolensis]|uniref:Polyketide cyclase / dehydrase and lipid transport n=1 Tax=Dermatophilus congolensis TaxID=1863 RepID=A0A239VCP5_9MICO|nr:SRPBCC family protein [Dermatophilus congolensis]MBO3130670.1 polyketide cyclase [Dermatophilus congolensis]MBO3130700.1 polyketide cyclase [Dermatophilus congolensis]MBO3135143.1 polyketide cyclase [Dermatophilus congolensis]MBO3137382.1 polyketide cyclase [Dermatophilus congolensis]MBO3139623.1 polyketide cyclase [Dermatophilus congolensis]
MSDEKKITISRTIDASPQAIFDILSNPARHAELDGTNTIVSDDKSDRVTAVGNIFTMNMNAEHMGGDYKTDNHVVGYDKDRLIAWKTAPAGTEPKGWQWIWELTPQSQDQTTVTLTYDWSAVTDKALLKKITFPVFPQEQLEASLAHLAETVSGS